MKRSERSACVIRFWILDGFAAEGFVSTGNHGQRCVFSCLFLVVGLCYWFCEVDLLLLFAFFDGMLEWVTRFRVRVLYF